MRLGAWFYSVQHAWRKSFFRLITIGLAVFYVVTTCIFFWLILPARKQSGTLIVHYNIYFGIDDVRQWAWIFLLPCLWLFFLVCDVVFALSISKYDPQAASSLLVIALFLSLLTIIGFYCLVRINV